MNKNYFNPADYSKKLMMAILVSGSLIIQSCSSDDGSPRLKEFDEKQIKESTKGVITEVEEVQPGKEYKIIDERIIDDKEKSIAIIHSLDGKIDTVSLRKMSSDKSPDYRYAGIRGLLMYSLAGSFFNSNLGSVSPNSSYYKNDAAFNKSTALKNNLESSARTRNVKVPRASSTGYGAGKSFRSFGG